MMTTDHSRFPLLRWLAILSLLILTGACVPQDLAVSLFGTVVRDRGGRWTPTFRGRSSTSAATSIR